MLRGVTPLRGGFMSTRSKSVVLSLCAFAGCSVLESGSSGAAGPGGYLAVLSGWDEAGPLSGTLEIERDDDDVVSGTARVRSGTGASSEYEVTGSIVGSDGDLSWGGYTGALQVSGSSFDGTFTGPGGAEGLLAGTRSDLEGGVVLCGTYDGDDAGVWNFVVSDKGALRGAFSGWVSGTLDGSVQGGRVSMQWRAPEDELAGSADGNLQGESAMGSWTGPDVMGTWSSDESVCP
jgi:hypothetical protein